MTVELGVQGETWTFVGVSIALIVSPGPDVALVTRHTLRAGCRAGIATSLGTSTGLAIHGLAAGLGLSAVLTTSPTALTVVKLVGATYLAGLGVRTLWALRQRGEVDDGRGKDGKIGLAPFWQGVLTNVLNPKVAVFFVTFLPQFVGPGDSASVVILRLAAAFVGMALTWLLLYTSLLGRIGPVLKHARVRRALEGITGSALLLLGLRLALSPA